MGRLGGTVIHGVHMLPLLLLQLDESFELSIFLKIVLKGLHRILETLLLLIGMLLHLIEFLLHPLPLGVIFLGLSKDSLDFLFLRLDFIEKGIVGFVDLGFVFPD